MSPLKRVVPFLRLFGLAAVFTLAPLPATLGAESVTIRGLTFINKGLVGVGRMPASLRDKFGETFGSGSGLAADPKSWTQTSAGYSGVLYMLPDRGYNVSGTIDYMPRINKLSLALTPIADPTGPATTDLQTSITANLDETILLTDSAGAPLTGLDSDGVILDVTGAFVPSTSNVAPGRFVSTGVNRILDSRNLGGRLPSATVTTSSAPSGRRPVTGWPYTYSAPKFHACV